MINFVGEYKTGAKDMSVYGQFESLSAAIATWQSRYGKRFKSAKALRTSEFNVNETPERFKYIKNTKGEHPIDLGFDCLLKVKPVEGDRVFVRSEGHSLSMKVLRTYLSYSGARHIRYVVCEAV